MKLDLGCGKDKIEGFTGVDLYEPSADIKDDIVTLSTFKDDSIDEIRAFHILEHMFEKDIKPALASMYRVLKPEGKVHIQVPDLVWLCQDFINQREDDRWGWKLQTLFGLQREDNLIGEMHKTGFSADRLRKLLIDTGFVNISSQSSWNEKYNQNTIDGFGMKPL